MRPPTIALHITVVGTENFYECYVFAILFRATLQEFLQRCLDDLRLCLRREMDDSIVAHLNSMMVVAEKQWFSLNQ